MPTQDTFSQAGGWLRGNRAGIEMLIDTSKSMLELINNVRHLKLPIPARVVCRRFQN